LISYNLSHFAIVKHHITVYLWSHIKISQEWVLRINFTFSYARLKNRPYYSFLISPGVRAVCWAGGRLVGWSASKFVRIISPTRMEDFNETYILSQCHYLKIIICWGIEKQMVIKRVWCI
jgi:hypothetical protein